MSEPPARDLGTAGAGSRRAIIAGAAVFALAAGVGGAIAWLTAEQDRDRTRAEVSATASRHAVMLHAALARATSTTHAIATAIAAGADPSTGFDVAVERLQEQIGGIGCAQWAEGAHVRRAAPADRCAKLLGGDPRALVLFRGDGAAALQGPFLLPNKQLAVVSRVRAEREGVRGTVIAIAQVADIVAEARLHELPGTGHTFAVVAPLQGDRVLASSTAASAKGAPLAQIPVSVGGVTLVLQVGQAGERGPLLGWAAAIVLLTALLMARLGHGLVAEAANLRAERRARERLEAKHTELLERFKQTEETRKRLAHADRITGLPDARYLSRFLDRQWLDFASDRAPIALMLVELDRFDLLFETAGPQKAEAALKRSAEAIAKLVTGDHELAVRFRGTAFGVFFRDGASVPKERAEQARAAIARLQIPNPSSPIAATVTASVGVVAGVPRPNDSMRSFAEAAESALKQARADGQNRVVVQPWPAQG